MGCAAQVRNTQLHKDSPLKQGLLIKWERISNIREKRATSPLTMDQNNAFCGRLDLNQYEQPRRDGALPQRAILRNITTE